MRTRITELLGIEAPHRPRRHGAYRRCPPCRSRQRGRWSRRHRMRRGGSRLGRRAGAPRTRDHRQAHRRQHHADGPARTSNRRAGPRSGRGRRDHRGGKPRRLHRPLEGGGDQGDPRCGVCRARQAHGAPRRRRRHRGGNGGGRPHRRARHHGARPLGRARRRHTRDRGGRHRRRTRHARRPGAGRRGRAVRDEVPHRRRVLGVRCLEAEGDRREGFRTIVTGRGSGHPVRGLKNRFSRECRKLEAQAAAGADVELSFSGSLKRAVDGDVEGGAVMAGRYRPSSASASAQPTS